ncbi:hypothetical protein G7Y89_g1312 [Cudoniella acicularis]|uniref:Uncharacterized protein n=1 Tax=Cudoniella acicularis TaxID=354080 RepID=A0A8H4RXA5_9HELO|nr:hypothetical protein G7Y89_g1312 [Cudoniella acicularis]
MACRDVHRYYRICGHTTRFIEHDTDCQHPDSSIPSAEGERNCSPPLSLLYTPEFINDRCGEPNCREDFVSNEHTEVEVSKFRTIVRNFEKNHEEEFNEILSGFVVETEDPPDTDCPMCSTSLHDQPFDEWGYPSNVKGGGIVRALSCHPEYMMHIECLVKCIWENDQCQICRKKWNFLFFNGTKPRLYRWIPNMGRNGNHEVQIDGFITPTESLLSNRRNLKLRLFQRDDRWGKHNDWKALNEERINQEEPGEPAGPVEVPGEQMQVQISNALHVNEEAEERPENPEAPQKAPPLVLEEHDSEYRESYQQEIHRVPTVYSGASTIVDIHVEDDSPHL